MKPLSPHSPTSPATGLVFGRFRDTRRDAAQASAYTRRVGLLRWGLPLGAGGVLLALMLWPIFGGEKLAHVVAENVPNLVVENLRLTGLDAANRPYQLTAKRALEVPQTKNVIDLESPHGELTMEDDAWLTGQALKGRFDQTNQKLWLGGNVELFNDEGSQMHTSEANVDMKDKSAWGEQPVVIQGDFGQIQGQGFRLTKEGRVMTVTGRSKAILNLHSSSTSDTTNP